MMSEPVTFQGERGAYSEMATLQYFPNAKVLPKKSFQDAKLMIYYYKQKLR
ncbi:MAG: Prephenate dehydratase [Nitrososphaeraceae archaeon]|nr:Prephenate dehydratase [Nitrososphaeraceae archaeon]